MLGDNIHGSSLMDGNGEHWSSRTGKPIAAVANMGFSFGGAATSRPEFIELAPRHVRPAHRRRALQSTRTAAPRGQAMGCWQPRRKTLLLHQHADEAATATTYLLFRACRVG